MIASNGTIMGDATCTPPGGVTSCCRFELVIPPPFKERTSWQRYLYAELIIDKRFALDLLRVCVFCYLSATRVRNHRLRPVLSSCTAAWCQTFSVTIQLPASLEQMAAQLTGMTTSSACGVGRASSTLQPQLQSGRSRRPCIVRALLQSQPSIRNISDLQAGVLKEMKANEAAELQLELRDVKVHFSATWLLELRVT